jgi:hypothetical protein
MNNCSWGKAGELRQKIGFKKHADVGRDPEYDIGWSNWRDFCKKTDKIKP